MLFKSQTDWMAEYNKYLETKGESATIGCILYDTESKETRYHETSHTKTDGLSFVVTGLRETGFPVKEFPTIKISQRLTLLQKIILGLKFIYQEVGPVRPIDWKVKKPEAPYSVVGPFGHFLSQEETSDLKKRARKYGVDIPTVLLYAINKAVDEYLINKKGTNTWYVPFNMRGIYEGPSETSNHISNFLLPLTQEDSLETILSKKFKILRSASFLVNFFFLNLGNFKPFRNMLKDKVDKDYKKPVVAERAIGSFAYLGQWPPSDLNHILPTTQIMPYGNVSLKNPICVSSMVWRGGLSFSVQIHSSIVDSKEVGQKVLQHILKVMKEI